MSGVVTSPPGRTDESGAVSAPALLRGLRKSRDKGGARGVRIISSTKRGPAGPARHFTPGTADSPEPTPPPGCRPPSLTSPHTAVSSRLLVWFSWLSGLARWQHVAETLRQSQILSLFHEKLALPTRLVRWEVGQPCLCPKPISACRVGAEQSQASEFRRVRNLCPTQDP